MLFIIKLENIKSISKYYLTRHFLFTLICALVFSSDSSAQVDTLKTDSLPSFKITVDTSLFQPPPFSPYLYGAEREKYANATIPSSITRNCRIAKHGKAIYTTFLASLIDLVEFSLWTAGCLKHRAKWSPDPPISRDQKVCRVKGLGSKSTISRRPEGLLISITFPTPPILIVPYIRTAIIPTIITIHCTTSVATTAFIPPREV